MISWTIGIDEVGRGPLAGPVMVGVVCLPTKFDWRRLRGVDDSKRLSRHQRDRVTNKASSLRQDGQLHYQVAMVSAPVIDQLGINVAISLALRRAINQLMINFNKQPGQCRVLLDGGLHAPKNFLNQTTIIAGDALEPVIGLASIVAKSRRDCYMTKKSREVRFAPYGFADHKGYGTKAHRRAIKRHGLSPLHRRSFCGNLING